MNRPTRRALLRSGVAAAVAADSPGCRMGSEEPELVLAGGVVVDGTGAEPFRADVGSRDGRIAAIGTVRVSRGAQVLDASGAHVAPGFVDIHTHGDRTNSESTALGQLAELVVFDASAVSDTATIDDAQRAPVVIVYVHVNGDPVVVGDEPAGA